MQIIIVGLGETKNNSTTKDIINVLKTLLSNELTAQGKMETLNNYGIVTTNNLEGEVTGMCNLSKGVLEKGFQQGVSQGIDKGKIQGMVTAVRAVMGNLHLSFEDAAKITGVPADLLDAVKKEIK